MPPVAHQAKPSTAPANGAVVVAAGCLGVLPFNFPRARIFMGDVGSGALGYLMAALAGLLIFPFFGSPGDYFMKMFSPEVMLYSHYTGLMSIFFLYMFGQYITQRFLPRLNWVKGGIYIVLCVTIGTMMFSPNVELFQNGAPIASPD